VPIVDDSTDVGVVCLGCEPFNLCDACVVACDWLAYFHLD
jgi:hypothetical protein